MRKTLAAIALFSALPAGATTFAEKWDLDELAGRADRVVVGEVLTTRTEVVEGSGLWTVATVYVEETLRGTPEPVVEVRYPGGRLDDLELTVVGAPRLIPGYEVLLFLRGDEVVGFGQGAFVVEDGRAWRPLDPSLFARPSADRDWDPDELQRRYLSYTLAEVRRAVR